ncbi:MAG: fimbrial protein [Enterobacteriaceae bacterium]|jgi:type 1 fimbria pilin|nr:fimbrial protein [Enterobacteriaceae bacterium]
MANKLKLLWASIFIVGLMSSCPGWAEALYGGCRFFPGEDSGLTQVSFGSHIVIPKNHAIGTTIKEVFLDQLYRKNYIAYCNKLMPVSWDAPDFSRAQYNNDAIYDSGVPGVGIRINNWPDTLGYGIDWFPRISNNLLPCSPPPKYPGYYIYYCGPTWGFLTVQLIKTAPTTGSGTISPLILTRARLGSNIIHSFYVESTKIESPTPSCALTNKITHVNMGDVKASQFVSRVTAPRDFNLELDCEAGAAATILLDGTPQDGSSTVWALDNIDDKATATGVGLQIWYKNRFLAIRDPNASIKVRSKEAARHFSLPLSARYVQTRERITPGKADVTVTVTLTYQ